MNETSSLPRDPTEDRRPIWKALLGFLGGVFLGGVFLVAVWAKAFDIQAFAEGIAHRELDVVLSASAVAYLALALETLIGVLLVLNVRRLWLLVPTAALVAFLLWVNLESFLEWKAGDVPPTTACGCFGNLVQRTPEEALWQDALLMLPALILAFVGRTRGTRFPPKRTVLAVLATLGVVVFAWQAPALPLDDLPFVTRLSPGKQVTEICAGKGEDEVCLTNIDVAPELGEGRRIVVIAELSDESFASAIGERVDELLRWEEDPERSRLVVLHAGEKDEEFAFGFRARGAPIDYRRAPYPLLRSLYRSLPRTFLIEDGVVVRTWNGLPPFSEVVAP